MADSSEARAGQTPVTQLRGVGAALAQKLKRIGIESVQDLVFHLPYRFEDRTHLAAIANLRSGQHSLLLGAIAGVRVVLGRRRSLLVSIDDGSGKLMLRFFHFNAQQQRAMEQANWMQVFGEVRAGSKGPEMVHPEYRVFQSEPSNITSDALTPVYSTTEGISQNRMRDLVNLAFAQFADSTEDLLPPSLRQQYQLLPLPEALATLHTPAPSIQPAALQDGSHPAQQRLALEELLAHHLALRAVRAKRAQLSAPNIQAHSSGWEQLRAALGFELTGAQLRAIKEITSDLSSGSPAMRLIQGDVGSGKTIVAAAAALHVVESGFQVAIMAPTELLAEQHRTNFEQWCAPLGIQTQWLVGRLGAVARREAVAAIEDGSAQIVIGTHALFQESVAFKALGLIVVDEQHRFGVDQRLALKKKGEQSGLTPHQIIMSATPIPRSLSMVFYADLDVSNIDELPPGRKPVHTVVIPNSRRDEVQARIKTACRDGIQAYWVCPLIDESEALQAEAATDAAVRLEAGLPDLSVALVHGRLKAAEKDAVMTRFRQGKIDVLVATTVIEVGVDVPTASLMIIENAERLGLAQLHQLRGRVGRGDQQAVCVLMYQSPLGRTSRARLDILRQTTDGFEVARKDLEQRGPGELMGTRQTGENQLKVANIVRDRALLPVVEQAASALIQQHPERVRKIIRRWVKSKSGYAEV